MKHPFVSIGKSIAGTRMTGCYTMSGNDIPVYEADTIHGLNQLIGYVKYKCREYGDVLYRGQARLYPSLIPALLRPFKQKNAVIRTPSIKRVQALGTLISTVMSTPIKGRRNKSVARDLNVDASIDPYARYKVEGILQHYGVPTKCIDLVDNHWIALWMGLNNCIETKISQSRYFHYKEREIPLLPMQVQREYSEEDLYQYILLLAMPRADKQSSGVFESDETIVIDLRKALPSTFLRPHAQHGIVALKKVVFPCSVNDYDMSGYVVCIIRIRIDIAKHWLGEGTLLSQENLFPAPSNDTGYYKLLQCNDLFKEIFEIAKFV